MASDGPAAPPSLSNPPHLHLPLPHTSISRQASAIADLLGDASVQSPHVRHAAAFAVPAHPSELAPPSELGLPSVESRCSSFDSLASAPTSPSKAKYQAARARRGERRTPSDDEADGDERGKRQSVGSALSRADSSEDGTPPAIRVVDLFSPGMLRIPVFRIPSLLPLPASSGGAGVVLAFAEARPALHDAGVIDLMLRRSTDGGLTWGAARRIVTGESLGRANCATVGNPTALFDAVTEKVWLLLCSNHADDAEWMIHARQGKDTRRVWVTSSADYGLTWAPPAEITSSVKRKNWTWYAVGPGVGVQLSSGRLVVPANHAEDVAEPHHPYLTAARRSRMVAHCFYSDDHGASWRLGGVGAPHTNEAQLAALPSGELLLNCRDWSGAFRRVVQTSADGGASWGPPRHDAALLEPSPQGCQASLLALPSAGGEGKEEGGVRRGGGGGVVLFCNPASTRREMLTLRRSDDGGRTWGGRLVLEEGAAAYSCLGMLDARTVGVLYERADCISFAAVPLDAIGAA